mmetsp:Transcript_9548/g.29616  ORF Transcript_9548/g.29616 Transcript_9548/m.29616 type:complete len:355 (-) Transcript_9548:14-1078(-)
MPAGRLSQGQREAWVLIVRPQLVLLAGRKPKRACGGRRGCAEPALEAQSGIFGPRTRRNACATPCTHAEVAEVVAEAVVSFGAVLQLLAQDRNAVHEGPVLRAARFLKRLAERTLTGQVIKACEECCRAVHGQVTTLGGLPQLLQQAVRHVPLASRRAWQPVPHAHGRRGPPAALHPGRTGRTPGGQGGAAPAPLQAPRSAGQGTGVQRLQPSGDLCLQTLEAGNLPLKLPKARARPRGQVRENRHGAPLPPAPWSLAAGRPPAQTWRGVSAAEGRHEHGACLGRRRERECLHAFGRRRGCRRRGGSRPCSPGAACWRVAGCQRRLYRGEGPCAGQAHRPHTRAATARGPCEGI